MIAAAALLLSISAGCDQSGSEDADALIGDALSPKHPEMTERFTGMDLQIEAPERPAALVVEELAEGSGDTVNYGMVARLHYIGSLASGKVFHSTYKGDDPKPAVVRLLPPGVPKGLALGLDGCQVGGRRLIRMPASLGFGDEPSYAHDVMVPARSTLVYEVELVEVVRGLEIKVLQEGTGEAELAPGGRGKFHYVGVLASDGTEFDASAPGQPRVFSIAPTGGLIAGWQLGLPGMKVGEKRRLRIPSELAYGEAGNPPKIEPGADLVFDVELAEIMP